VFRASKRYLQLKLLNWGVGQFFTLVGLIVALVALRFIADGPPEIFDKAAPEAVIQRFAGWFEQVPHKAIILRFAGWFEVIGVVGFLVQLPLSLVPVILDWEMRWYIVTDRSLRIREGIWKVSELTLTFANVQEVSIRQGPIERLFGIANLRVRTAGGGGRINPQDPQSEEKSGHIGYFRGVDNAPAIRDLILERLKKLRDAGLGDPDQPQAETAGAEATSPPAIADAARELLRETRALRRVVSA
jgi:membrane protein YdbS with pleckstrin-like domain